MAIVLLGCGSDYTVNRLNEGNYTQAYDDLNGAGVSFQDYCGTLIDVYPTPLNPSSALGTVWQRDFCCREGTECGDCGFIPDFANLNQEDLTLNEENVLEDMFQVVVSIDNGILSGLLPFLNIEFQETSIAVMNATLTYEGKIKSDGNIDNAVEDFDYGDATKEQAYLQTIRNIDVITKEYRYYGTKPNGADSDLYDFGGVYYYDSGLFVKSYVSQVCLQPFSPRYTED